MTLTQQLAQFIASGIVNGTIYALLGLGLVAIHSVTRVVSVAQGEFAALGALLASTLVAGEMPLPLAAGVAVMAAAAVGGGVYRIGIRPAHDAGPLTLLIITIALHLALKGLLLLVWGTNPYGLRPFTAGPPLRILSAAVAGQSPWAVGVTAVCPCVLYLFFPHTTPGKPLPACARDP